MMQNPSMTPLQMHQAHQYAAALAPGNLAAGRGMMPGGMQSPGMAPNMAGVTGVPNPWAGGQQAGGIRPAFGATPNLQGVNPAANPMVARFSSPQAGAAI
jgi:hypothetical protein